MLSDEVRSEFERHSERLRTHAREKRKSVLLRSIVTDTDDREAFSADDMLGRRQPTDEFQGDVNLRTLRALLTKIDEQGFERVRFLQLRRFFSREIYFDPSRGVQSPHQLKFHSAFERAAARVIYRQDWATMRPAIMKKNGWPTCPSEVLISTPRRFGKVRSPSPSGRGSVAHASPGCTQTFSIAIFAACLALTLKCEVVVFRCSGPSPRASVPLLPCDDSTLHSPARRASRKLLERMVRGAPPCESSQVPPSHNVWVEHRLSLSACWATSRLSTTRNRRG